MADSVQIEEQRVEDQKKLEEARRNEPLPRWLVRGRTDTDRGRTDTDRGRTDTDRGRTDTDRGRTDTDRGFGVGGPGTDRAVGDIFHTAASLGGHLIVAMVAPISASIRSCNSAPHVSNSGLSPDEAATLARVKRLEYELKFREEINREEKAKSGAVTSAA